MTYVIVVSTLVYGIISLGIEVIMSHWHDYSIYVHFSPFLQLPPFTAEHTIAWLMHGFILSMMFFIGARTSANCLTGLRYGIVISCLCILLCLSQMFGNTQTTPTPFFTESLLSLCLVNSIRFILFGAIIGYLYKYYSDRKPRIEHLWL